MDGSQENKSKTTRERKEVLRLSPEADDVKRKRKTSRSRKGVKKKKSLEENSDSESLSIKDSSDLSFDEHSGELPCVIVIADELPNNGSGELRNVKAAEFSCNELLSVELDCEEVPPIEASYGGQSVSTPAHLNDVFPVGLYESGDSNGQVPFSDHQSNKTDPPWISMDDIDEAVNSDSDMEDFKITDSTDIDQILTELDTIDDSILTCGNDEKLQNFHWSSNPEIFVGKQEFFTGNPGPTFDTNGLSPLDIFQRIWDDTIINLIMKETNKYGRQLLSNKVWQDFKISDIWVFLATIMLQSLVPLVVEREYWYPCLPILKMNFNNIMSYKKFALLKRCLHFVDNSKLGVENKKMRKIMPVITHLNMKFRALYLPGRNIAIEESLLLSKEKPSLAKTRVGIKNYELYESETGYLWNMMFYTNEDGHDSKTTTKIVFHLLKPLLYKGHTLILDQYNSSPLLSRMLKRKNTDTFGPLRLNQQNVPETIRKLTKADLKQGETTSNHTDDLTITVHHDVSFEAYISTYHRPSTVREKSLKNKPEIVIDYINHTSSVDRKTQTLQAFPVERSGNTVWYKKIFRKLLNLSIYNAFVIYNHGKNWNQRQFRVALAQEILDKMKIIVPEPRHGMTNVGHYPCKSRTSKARCKLCAKKKVISRTVWQCDVCGVNLCIVGCFREYHERDRLIS